MHKNNNDFNNESWRHYELFKILNEMYIADKNLFEVCKCWY